jgi:hypothetical protein
MLDVHAPEHGIHGARDFFVHLLTITAGLLIALGLENAAEAVHHRHQRKEAEAMIRQEIQENRQAVMDGAQALKDEIAGMTKALDMLDAMSAGQKFPKGTIKEEELHFRQGPMQDSAWRTAGSTGALSYMDYAEVEKFSQAYKEQDELQATSEQALNDYLLLMPVLARHGRDMTPERAKEALPFARSAAGHLSGMYFIGAGTLGSYDAALK